MHILPTGFGGRPTTVDSVGATLIVMLIVVIPAKLRIGIKPSVGKMLNVFCWNELVLLAGLS